MVRPACLHVSVMEGGIFNEAEVTANAKNTIVALNNAASGRSPPNTDSIYGHETAEQVLGTVTKPI